MIGRYALQTADRDGLLLDPGPPARRLTGPVAHPAEDAGKDVGVPIDEVRFGESALGDQPDVLGNIGVGRAGPLAIDHTMKVVGVGGICSFHDVPLLEQECP